MDAKTYHCELPLWSGRIWAFPQITSLVRADSQARDLGRPNRLVAPDSGRPDGRAGRLRYENPTSLREIDETRLSCCDYEVFYPTHLLRRLLSREMPPTRARNKKGGRNGRLFTTPNNYPIAPMPRLPPADTSTQSSPGGRSCCAQSPEWRPLRDDPLHPCA